MWYSRRCPPAQLSSSLLYLQFAVPESFPEPIYHWGPFFLSCCFLPHYSEPHRGQSCVTDIPHCNYTSGFQILFVPISIFKLPPPPLHRTWKSWVRSDTKFVFCSPVAGWNLIWFSSLFLGACVCEGIYLLRKWPQDTPFEVWPRLPVNFLPCHWMVSMLSLILAHVHMPQRTWRGQIREKVIVTQANCFPRCVYWPVTQL